MRKIKEITFILMIFVWAYLLASFTNMEIDCRKWSELSRWGVIWGSTVATVVFVAVRSDKWK